MRRKLTIIALLLALGFGAGRQDYRREQPLNSPKSYAGWSQPDSPTRARISESYGQLPLSFVANQGQSDHDVKFLSHGNGYQLKLKATAAELRMAKSEAAQQSDLQKLPAAVCMQFVNANPAPQLSGRDELPGKHHYYIGNNPKAWRTNVATYAKVEYEQIWPGINLIYYGNQRQLEYDFIVAPGADPSAIHFTFDGADQVNLDAQGNLVLQVADGEVVLQKPFVYQEVNGTRHEIAGSYQIRKQEVGFDVGAYDASQPLVIDPVLVYSTFLGPASRDIANDIAVDQAGNVYITGASFFSSEGWNAFVAKVNAAGTALVYSTAFIGSRDEIGFGVAVDAAGNAYATGFTRSTNFPVKNAFQPRLGATDCRNAIGCPDAFVAKLDAAGTVAWSTYLGGNDNPGDISAGGDLGYDIAVDASGQAVVVGYTISRNFPVKNAYQPAGAVGTGSLNTVSDGFITKFNPAGNDLVFSTYLGGNGIDACHGIALDAAGNAYVTGQTNRVFNDVVNSFPTTANAFQRTPAPDLQDGFVAKLSAAGNALVYSTYLGGNNSDQGEAIAVDSSGNAYIIGATSSTNFPLDGAHQSANLGGSAFVTKLNPSGSGLLYSSYLGKQVWTRTGNSPGAAIAVDAAGMAYVIGSTSAADFPVVNALYPTFGGGSRDAYIAKINTVAMSVVYVTYLGGSVTDYGYGIALDAAGNVYATGETNSANFPLKNPLQPTLGSSDFNSDTFVTKIGEGSVSCPALGLQDGLAGPTQCQPAKLLLNIAPEVIAGNSALISLSARNANDTLDTEFTGPVQVSLAPGTTPKLACLKLNNSTSCAASQTVRLVFGLPLSGEELRLQTPEQPLTATTVLKANDPPLAGNVVVKAVVGTVSATYETRVKSPLDLKIDRIEVQQGYKPTFAADLNGPWVQYRDLMIRVFLDANRTEFKDYFSIHDISASLTVRDQTGTQIEGSPFQLKLSALAKGTDSPSQPYIFQPNAPLDAQGNESLNHVLYVTQQQLNLSVKLDDVYPDKDPTNNEKSLQPLRFVTSKPTVVLYSPAMLKTGAISTVCPSEVGIANEINLVELAYPVSLPESAGQLRFIPVPNPNKTEACEVLTSDPLPKFGTEWWFWLNRTKRADVKAWVYFVDRSFFSLTDRPSHAGISNAMGGSVAIVSDPCRGPDSNTQCGILAHELGHLFNLGDTYQSTSVTPVRSPNNPALGEAAGNPVGIGSYSWFHHRFVVSGTDLVEFMGATNNPWTDRVNWNYLRTQLLPTTNSTAPEALDALADATAADNFVIVQGQVRKNSAAEFTTCYTLTGAGLADAAGAGDYVIETLDANAAVLNSQRFAPNFRPPESDVDLEAAPFSFALPFSSAVRQLRLRSSAGILATRQVSANAPVISLTTDFGGQTLTGSKTVRWNGSDADGNVLRYSLFYSPDGQLQIPLALETTDTSYEWNTAEVAASSSARLTLTATDGVNATTIESRTFTLPNHAPNVVILTPAHLQQFKTGEPVPLSASLYDTEDGLAFRSVLNWSSDLQGALGTGSQLAVNNLQAGTHRITATGADSQGARDSATITIIVRADNFSNLEATPGNAEFGTVTVGQTRDFNLRVQNTGNAALTINAVTSNNPQFRVLAPTAPFTIAARSEQELMLRFAPVAAGDQSGTLTITGNASNRPSLNIVLTGKATGATARSVTTVSAASYSGQTLSAESIVAAFGTNLSTSVAVADKLPLPTSLAGTTVKVRDSAGAERLAPLFFVAPRQINYLVPAGTATGVATITVTSGDGALSVGNVTIANVAPGLFAANANGQGVASGVILRFNADGTTKYEDINRYDSAQQRFVAVPIEFKPDTSLIVLALFGTGLRGRSSLGAVSVKIGGVEAPEIYYVGEQPTFTGLDQLNAQLPRSLVGRGEVDVVLTVDGQTANTVRIAVAGSQTCNYAITPSSQSVPSTGGTSSVNVTATSGCAWTATSNASFITINSGASGTGNGTVNFTVAANTAGSRTGTITVAGQTFTVTQAGRVCSYSIPMTSQSFPAAGGTASVNVTATTGCTWTAASNVNFITITSGANGNGNGTVNFSVAANTTTSPRSGTMSIAGITFTVTQAAAAAFSGSGQARPH